jgi:hypothetical protein
MDRHSFFSINDINWMFNYFLKTKSMNLQQNEMNKKIEIFILIQIIMIN